MKNSLAYHLTAIFVLMISSELIFSQPDKEVQTCPPGLISYWKLDEFGNVSTFLDSYGGINASSTESGRPLESTGIVNRARSFNDNSIVTVPSNNAFNWNFNESFSIELWIKTTQPGTGNRVFLGRPAAGNFKMSWWLGYGDSNKTIFSVRDSSGVRSQILGKKIINDGVWHLIAGVKNDSMHVLQLYVDGVLETIETTFYTGDFSSTDPIYIGVYGSSFHFIGLLDEIAVYNKILSQAQIMQHYNAGLQGKGYCDQFTSVENAGIIPHEFNLSQNYPNPFNPGTNIKVDIPKSGNITLTVYNVVGEKVRDLFNGFLQPGVYDFPFNGKDLTSGIYFYKMQADNFTRVKKMLLLK